MIISNLVASNVAPPPAPETVRPTQFNIARAPRQASWTRAGAKVSEDTAKKIATAYRCADTISNDVGLMPLQVFNSFQGSTKRIFPDSILRNTAYLVERQPNRWMTPFLWKRTIMNWLIWWGNAYVWSPPSSYPELFILDSSRTFPVFDADGNKWYVTSFPNMSSKIIPDVEMVHLMVNSKDGLQGMSVLEYGKETMGRQLRAHETQDDIAGNGLMPVAAVSVDSKGKSLSPDSRETLRKNYIDAAKGGVAVFDDIIKSLDPITMKATDAQFLEGIAATDADIANFFNFPLHKLNMGKQSYESNEQQELGYLRTCLNAFLVPWEQAAGLKWVPEANQPFTYLRFNRDSLLQTDAKTRADILIRKVQGGVLTPNEALQIDDQNGYVGGDSHYMPLNYGTVQPDGTILGATQAQPVPSTGQQGG